MGGSGQDGFYSYRETWWLEIKMLFIIFLQLSIQREKIQQKFRGILAEQNLSKTAEPQTMKLNQSFSRFPLSTHCKDET